MRPILFSLALFSAASAAAAGELHIVPVYAPNVRGADGLWTSSLVVFNQTDQPITAHLAGAFPATGASCSCVPEITIAPRDFGSFGDDTVRALGSATIGALAIETSDRARVESTVLGYDPSRPETANSGLEEIRVARSWIPAGRKAWMLLPYDPYVNRALMRANLFIVNPNDVPLTVRYGCWDPRAVAVAPGSDNDSEITLLVAPRSTSVSIPACHLPAGVGVIDNAGPFHLEIRADREFYASASIVTFGVARFISPNY